MERQVTCIECETIARELAEAYAEQWNAADPHTQQAWEAIQKMLGGTEEDVRRAEELTQPVRYRPTEELVRHPDLVTLQRSPVIRALLKKFAHESLTQHKVPFRSPW